MVRNIADSVVRIKHDVAAVLDRETILQACQNARHVWRDCLLDPVTTIYLFCVQILEGNTACTHLVHFSDQWFSASAYCKTRMRLGLSVFEHLLKWMVEQFCGSDAAGASWRGHRVFLVDGSGVSMPDIPALQEHFGQPGGQQAGCGFPAAHLLLLVHAGTGMLMDLLVCALRTHDAAQVSKLHPKLTEGDVVVGDRGFCSFVHLALLGMRKLHGVFRIHQHTIVDFTAGRPHARGKQRIGKRGLPSSRWLRALGVTDQLVEWFKPTQRPRWMTDASLAALPDSIVVRETRYEIRRRGFRTRTVTLVTTLTDPEAYPAQALAELYGLRWQIELDIRHLKQTMKMDVLKCKTVEGVHKELFVFALVYNLVRMAILEAARQQAVPLDRISFVDALRWLAEGQELGRLARLIVNPVRRDRIEPRVRKRRPKQYPLMQKPRAVLRNRLESYGLAA